MYDARSEAHEFIAETKAEAVSKASSYFGVSEDELTIQEYAPESVSGAAGRTVVVAQPTESVGKAPARGGDREERGDRGDRGGRDRDRSPRGGRGRDRDDRGGRGGRDRDRDRGDRGGRGRDRDRGDRGDRGDRERAAAPVLSDEPSVGTAQGDLGPIGQFVLGAVERMDIGPFQVSESEDEKYIIVQVAGAAAEALSGGDGRAPDALQLLANQAAGQEFEDPKRVVVDVEGDREKREDLLGRIAERAAKRARDTGRSVALEPMNPKDRRGVHVALRDTDDIATMSIGEGRYRQVLVVPEGAPEYEEASKAE
ncbi:MAG: R3H domain-containing nucleic acid-binding protein [Myxococcota bacterium]|nr:R3H domain-containing nucleic acid-binding protein [Myxococcota bacterium]